MDAPEIRAVRPPLPALFAAPDIEEAALACVCQFPAFAIPFFRARAAISHFTVPRLTTVYQVALELFDGAGGFDLHTLQEYLRANGELAAIGGEPFVTDLFTANVPPAMLEYYTSILGERYANRRFAELAARLAHGAATADELNGLASNAQRELEAITASLAGDAVAALRPRLFDASNPPPEPQPVWKLRGASIATPGNLQAVQAQAKAGKTAVVVALMAAVLGSTGDCFTFESENPLELAVLHFDTEQSPYDHHQCIARALRRAGLDAAPSWFLSYHVTDLPLTERKRLVRAELSRAAAAHGGVLAVIIDGIGDLCADLNNTAESFALVDELHQLAIKHATCILCVLHENPGSESGKTRGHLGSQLQRKAETNIRLDKDVHGVTVIYADKARHTHIPKSNGVRFAWDDEAKMHLTTSEPFGRKDVNAADKDRIRKNSALVKAKETLMPCFRRGATVRCADAARKSKLKDSTFENYWKRLKEAELIERTEISHIWRASKVWSAEMADAFDDEPDEPDEPDGPPNSPGAAKDS